MVPNQRGRAFSRPARLAGVLLAGFALAACGQGTQETGPSPSPVREQPPTSPGTGGTGTGTPSPGGNAATTPSSSSEGREPARGSQSPAAQQAQETGRCHTSMLSGTFDQGRSGAGQRHAELILTNESSQSCVIYGYGGLQLIGSDGEPLPTDLTRSPNPGPQRVLLTPGESAAKRLHWGVVPTGDEPVNEPCQPEPASAQVIPPDETDALTISWDMGRVCGHGHIEGSAYYEK